MQDSSLDIHAHVRACQNSVFAAVRTYISDSYDIIGIYERLSKKNEISACFLPGPRNLAKYPFFALITSLYL